MKVSRHNGTLAEPYLCWLSDDPEASDTAASSKYSEFAGMIHFFFLVSVFFFYFYQITAINFVFFKIWHRFSIYL